MDDQVITVEKKGTKRNHKAMKVNVQASIIISVCNQEKELLGVHRALIEGLQDVDFDFEVIFVDDGSEDNSWQVLKEIAAKDSRVKIIRMRASFGESATFDAGFNQAMGDKIVFFTARVRINPSQIGKLIERLDVDSDIVMGWRYPRRDSGLNQFISKMFNRIIKKLSKTRINDVNSGVFAAKREVLDDIPLYGNLNIFLPVLAARKGYVVRDEKIEQMHGKFRQSTSFTDYLHRLLDIVSVVFLTNYSKKPLHFLGFIGSIFTLAGLGMNLYLFFYRLFQFGPIAGRPLLLLGALLLVIGIQMISIGLLGEMIIFTHAKEIKEYTIEEILE